MTRPEQPSPAAAEGRGSAMMTFNLRRAIRSDGRNAWENRRDAAARVILDHAPDIVATQECTLAMLHDLDERLAGYERVGGDKEHWPGEEPNAIYYDPARVRVLDAGVFWLSRTPLVVGSRTWGEWGRRSALWARFVDLRAQGAFLVVNTHLDHVSMLSRRRSAKLLHRAAPEAIIAGDFNTWPRRYVHTVLLDGRYDPLRNARHTHNAFTLRDRGRIDWILVPEHMRVLHAEVLDPRRPDGGPVSDHLPVLVEIEPPVGTTAAPVPQRRWTGETPVETKLPPAPLDGASLRLAAAVAKEP